MRPLCISAVALLSFGVGYLAGYFNAQQEFRQQNIQTNPAIKQMSPTPATPRQVDPNFVC